MHAVSSAAREEKEEGCLEDLGAVEGPAMREDDPPRAAEIGTRARGHLPIFVLIAFAGPLLQTCAT